MEDNEKRKAYCLNTREQSEGNRCVLGFVNGLALWNLRWGSAVHQFDGGTHASSLGVFEYSSVVLRSKTNGIVPSATLSHRPVDGVRTKLGFLIRSVCVVSI